jgi:hypothetical protein
MANQDREASAMQEIKNWIETNSFKGPSNEEMKWLQDKHQKGDFTDDNVVEAGAYAYDQAREAALQNENLREKAYINPSKVDLSFWADAEDDNTDLAMLRDNRDQRVTRAAGKDLRQLRRIAALAKIYHCIPEENKQLEDEIVGVEFALAWLSKP